MIKIISKDKFEEIQQENLLLKLRLYNIVGDYSKYTYTQLLELRRTIIWDLKGIDKRLRELEKAIGNKF